MLYRIVVVGGSESIVQDEGTASSKGIEILSVKPGAALPPGTTAIVAETAAAAVDGALRLGVQQDALMRLLADAIDCRESIPLGASERVRDHAERFANVLKLSAADQLTLERGALVRDIGKLRITNDVLLKKSVLTYDEFLLLQQHTSLGVEVLEQAGVFIDTIDIVKHHHEAYDGTGYPDRLEKDDIPLSARIMKLLDVYCAMTSPRSYRESHASHEEAVAHLTEERGKHFDPELVDAFVTGKVGRPMKEAK
jgi:response regulator RpfG family c-di-GMP phosphodiesterase